MQTSERRKIYREENFEYLQAQERERYLRIREEKMKYASAYQKSPKGLLVSARKRAKRDNLPFNIVLEDIVVPRYCPVLGIELKYNSGRMCDSSPSLDRMIPELGYVKGNIFVISWRANALKKNGTVEEFEKIVSYMKKPNLINFESDGQNNEEEQGYQ